jgi:hypothetical protein
MRSSTRSRAASLLVIIGALCVVATVVVGFRWGDRVPDLTRVDYGQEWRFTSTGSGEATIFTPVGQAEPPTCQVTADRGDAVELAQAERYQQSGGLESAFTFAVAPDRTYDVVCGSPGQAGRFGVAQVSPLPRVPLLAGGALGVLLVASGVTVALHRSGRPAPSPRGNRA